MLGVALRDSGLGLRDVCVLARAADDMGYRSIWFPEVGSRDAIALASLVGQQTHKASVGTGVVPVFSRNVVSLCLAAATAAEATEGRFVLGLGAGHQFTTEAWFDRDWSHAKTRLRETVEVARRILAGERVTHHGQITVDGFHLGCEPPRVPIYLAALGPATLRMAGEIADGVLLNWLPPDGMERAGLLAREAAADAERSVKVMGYVRVAVTEGPDQREEAEQALREHTYSYSILPSYAASMRSAGLGDAVDRLGSGDDSGLGKLVDSLCCWGDADIVRSDLTRFEESGLDATILYPVPFGDDPAQSILRTLRALAPRA
ncbi:MAG TPA: LLM class flavin-dependent oxidoreductase [Actinomycetota bacterium]|nr:LLM class flavin-dependent oxidoreductase [Actinomycetota bacterium]